MLGSYDWIAGIDLWNLVFIGLSQELSKELSEQEKLEILEKEYEIPLEEKIRKDV